ncbi:MAG: sugar nucleotide-binding protein [Candidatus Latescibacteria bacterium]|nr:sugar nucleotide-binding protein [Candidatus Latescibacterota bacterium]
MSDIAFPLLITGVAGVSGYNAFRYFHKQYPGQVIGTRRVDNWPLQGDGIVPLNADDTDGMNRLFDEYQFGSVLNCEGTCKLKSCELAPENARRINVSSVDTLLSAARPDTRIVTLSVDLVFSGTGSGGHLEEDPTDPVTVYGKNMVDAEQLFLDGRPDACILRISLPMGISFNGHAGAIDWIQSRFKKSLPATLYYDEVRTPTYTDCLNRLLEIVLSNQFKGLYHAGGPSILSLYQIAQIVNRIGGYDPSHLMGCLRHEASPIPPRAGNVTMNSEKLKTALGFDPFDIWPYHEDHIPTHHDWHHERLPDEEGSPEYLSEVLYKNPRLQIP